MSAERAWREMTWVVLGPEPHFATCRRCGKHVPMPKLGIPLDAFTAYCEYACALHARCTDCAIAAAEAGE